MLRSVPNMSPAPRRSIRESATSAERRKERDSPERRPPAVRRLLPIASLRGTACEPERRDEAEERGDREDDEEREAERPSRRRRPRPGAGCPPARRPPSARRPTRRARRRARRRPTERRRLSVRSWRTMRTRGAPSVARSATSPTRSEARTRRRLATFAQAIRSTIVTEPISTQRAVRTSATCVSSSGSKRVTTSRCESGNASESWADAASMRVATCSRRGAGLDASRSPRMMRQPCPHVRGSLLARHPHVDAVRDSRSPPARRPRSPTARRRASASGRSPPRPPRAGSARRRTRRQRRSGPPAHVVLRGDVPPERRLETEDRQETVRDAGADHHLGLAHARERGPAGRVAGHLQPGHLLLPVAHVRVVDAPRAAPSRVSTCWSTTSRSGCG